jgi:hypothetical protein
MDTPASWTVDRAVYCAGVQSDVKVYVSVQAGGKKHDHGIAGLRNLAIYPV